MYIKTAWRYFTRGLLKELKATNQRNKILSYGECKNTEDSLRMYIVVNRPILPLVHAGVQAAHSVSEFLSSYSDTKTHHWATYHKTMIVLEVEDSKDIDILLNKVNSYGMRYSIFREPDMSNQITAIAFEPMTKSTGEVIFSNYKLLS